MFGVVILLFFNFDIKEEVVNYKSYKNNFFFNNFKNLLYFKK